VQTKISGNIMGIIMSGNNSKIKSDLETADLMIHIFCQNRHGRREGLCPECRELLEYVTLRLKKCPLRENKPRCSKCPVHCYKPEMRERIRAVMKYAGPRMLYRHPVRSWKHYVQGK
jgi:predicted amidophosphoribosyltransferase